MQHLKVDYNDSTHHHNIGVEVKNICKYTTSYCTNSPHKQYWA